MKTVGLRRQPRPHRASAAAVPGCDQPVVLVFRVHTDSVSRSPFLYSPRNFNLPVSHNAAVSRSTGLMGSTATSASSGTGEDNVSLPLSEAIIELRGPSASMEGGENSAGKPDSSSVSALASRDRIGMNVPSQPATLSDVSPSASHSTLSCGRGQGADQGHVQGVSRPGLYAEAQSSQVNAAPSASSSALPRQESEGRTVAKTSSSPTPSWTFAHYSADQPSLMHPSGSWICRAVVCTEKEMNYANGAISVHQSLTSKCPGVNEMAKGKTQARVMHSYNEVRRRYGLSHVELTVTQQFISRSEMFLISEALRERILYAGEELVLCGFRLRVAELLFAMPTPSPAASATGTAVSANGPKTATLVRVGCGLVMASTLINFQSLSPIHYLVVELSWEMWGTTLEGRTTLTCALKKFVGELIQEQLPRRKMLPHLRVVFTGRLRPGLRLPSGDADLYHTLDIPTHASRAVDVVAEVELHCEAFLQSVLHQVVSSNTTLAATAAAAAEDSTFGSTKVTTPGSLTVAVGARSPMMSPLSPPGLTRQQLFVPARHSNTLETLCMIAEQCSQHYMNRMLDRSGHLITVLSAGKAHYVVTNSLVQVVAARLHDVGIEKVSVVCVGRPPLHVTPLLEYHSSDATLRTQYHLAIDVAAPETPFARLRRASGAGRYYELPAWMSVAFYYPRLHTAAGVVMYDLLPAHEWRRRYADRDEHGVDEMQSRDELTALAAVTGCTSFEASPTAQLAWRERKADIPTAASEPTPTSPPLLLLRKVSATTLLMPFVADSTSPRLVGAQRGQASQGTPQQRIALSSRSRVQPLLLPGLVPSQDTSRTTPMPLLLPNDQMSCSSAAQRAEQTTAAAYRPATPTMRRTALQGIGACGNKQAARVQPVEKAAPTSSRIASTALCGDPVEQRVHAARRSLSQYGAPEEECDTPRDVPSPVRSSLRSFIACSLRPSLLRDGEVEGNGGAGLAATETATVVLKPPDALSIEGHNSHDSPATLVNVVPTQQDSGVAAKAGNDECATPAVVPDEKRHSTTTAALSTTMPSSPQVNTAHFVRATWYTLHDAPRVRARQGPHAGQAGSSHALPTTPACGSHPSAHTLRAATSLESGTHVDDTAAVNHRGASAAEGPATLVRKTEEPPCSGVAKDDVAPCDVRHGSGEEEELSLLPPRCSSATRPDASRCGCNVVDSDLRSGHLVLELTLNTAFLPAHRWSSALLHDTDGWLRLMGCFVGRDDRLTSTASMMPPLAATATTAEANASRTRRRRELRHGPGGLTFHSDFRAQEIFCRSFSGITADGLTLILPTHANQCVFHAPEQILFCYQAFLFRREPCAVPSIRPTLTHASNNNNNNNNNNNKEEDKNMSVAAAVTRSEPISIVHSAARQAEPPPPSHPVWSVQASSSSGELNVSLPQSEEPVSAPVTAAGTARDGVGDVSATAAHVTQLREDEQGDEGAAAAAATCAGSAAVVCYVQLRNSLLFAIRPVNPLLPLPSLNANNNSTNNMLNAMGNVAGVQMEDDTTGAATTATTATSSASAPHVSHALSQGVEGISTATIFRRRWHYRHPELGLEAPHVASWTRLCACKLLPLYGTRSVYPPDSFYTVPPHQYTVVSEDAGEVRRRLREFVLQRLQQQYQIVLEGGMSPGGEASVWQPGWPRGEPAANVRVEMSIGHQTHLLKLSESARALTVTRLLHRGMYSNDPATHLFSYRYGLWNYLDEGRLAGRELHMEAQIGEQRAFPWEALDLWVLERPIRHLPRGPLLHPRAYRIALVLLPEDPTRMTPFAEFSSFIQYRFSIHLATQNKVTWEDDPRPLFTLPAQTSPTQSNASHDARLVLPTAAEAAPALIEAVLVQDDTGATRERLTRIDSQSGRIVALEEPVEERLTAIDILLPQKYNARCCYILRVRWLACAAAIVMDWHGSFVATATRYHLRATPLPCRDDSSAEDESEDEGDDDDNEPTCKESSTVVKSATTTHTGSQGDAVCDTVRGGDVFAVSYDVFATTDTPSQPQDSADVVSLLQHRLFAWLTHSRFQYFAESPVPFARCRLVHISGLCYVILAPRTCGAGAAQQSEPAVVARWCQNVSVQQGTAMQKELLQSFQQAVQLAREGIAVPERMQAA